MRNGYEEKYTRGYVDISKDHYYEIPNRGFSYIINKKEK